MGDDDERAPAAGQRARRWAASQSTPSTSRWLVGSSSSSDVVVADQQRGQRHPAALAAGQPADERVETADAGRVAARRAARRGRPGRRASAAQSWSGTLADHGVPHGRRRVEVVGLGEQADA